MHQGIAETAAGLFGKGNGTEAFKNADGINPVRLAVWDLKARFNRFLACVALFK